MIRVGNDTCRTPPPEGEAVAQLLLRGRVQRLVKMRDGNDQLGAKNVARLTSDLACGGSNRDAASIDQALEAEPGLAVEQRSPKRRANWSCSVGPARIVAQLDLANTEPLGSGRIGPGELELTIAGN